VTAVKGDWAAQVKWLRDNDPTFSTATVVLTGSNAESLTSASGTLAGRRGRVSHTDRTLLCLNRRPVVGVIYDASTSQTWSAVKGGGTRRSCGPISVRHRPTPHGPILGWTQGHAVDRSDSAAWALKLTLEQHAQRLLQLWAPLLCWVMLARGDIDGFVGYRPGAIDLPAGSLIAAEAGFSVVTLSGDPFDESVSDAGLRSFVAGHPARIPELLRLVRAAEATKSGLRSLLGSLPALVL
jgi:fructose-1,6-bisphosphatase/inositol monophosphatase family enzyme